MKHSKIVGSSTAARRMACPGSIDLEAGVPEPPETSYAAEGTALHSAMEWLLENHQIPGDMVGMEFYGHTIDGEYVDLLNYCLEAFNEVVGPAEFQTETTYAFPRIEGAFGTGDVVWFDGDRAGIMDWKFGGGIEVKTPGNMQAKFLLCGMRHVEEDVTRDTKLFATFVQPRFGYAETVEFSHAELDAFEADLHHAVFHRRYDDDNLRTGSHCKFCRAIATCPKRHAEARRAFDWGKVAQQDLPAALALADSVEDWVREVRASAHQALEAGAPLQGWKLVQKRGSREWIEQDPQKLERLLYRKLGLLHSQRHRSSIISPAQAEKLVGKARVGELVRTVEGEGTTLARADDKRPEVAPATRSLGNLFSAMKSASNTGD